jgi:hypothetical protein
VRSVYTPIALLVLALTRVTRHGTARLTTR